jgi:adenylate cyclase
VSANLADRERRLATIMVADIVGYSRLMDADEDRTYTALRAARAEVIDPKIKEYGGRIVKHLGDGFLAEFPTVMAAIQFAMSFQEEEGHRAAGVPKEQQIKFRIGINLGDVIVDEDGDLFGDGVNVAARLEGLAIPGGICISGPVYETVRKKLDADFENLGDQRVKNISNPIQAYDIRWPGEAGKPEDRPVKLTAKPKPMGLIAGGAAAAVAVIGFVLWQMNPFGGAVETAPNNSIAVLPFLNMSDDAGNEYFSDGISEELLNLLVKIPELRVTSRSSAFAFKGEKIDIPEVARQLNVTHILEGSVRKAGNQVRITAQLIEAHSDIHLWSETYDRTLSDIFLVQDEIAGAVVEALKLELLGERPRTRVADPEAYALFLQGRYFNDRRDQINWDKSVEAYRSALEIDPEYAESWAGLSITLAQQASWGIIGLDEGMAQAREAVDRSLALDPGLPEAHISLGWIRMVYDWNWRGADESYQTAIRLAPGNATALSAAGVLALTLGRLDEAVKLDLRAIALDPLRQAGHANLGLVLLNALRLEEASERYHHLLELNPEYPGAHMRLGQILLLQGHPQEALDTIANDSDSWWQDYAVPLALHSLGRQQEAAQALADFMAKHSDGPFQTAEIFAWRGEIDQAFEWLERAYVERDSGLHEMMNDPFLARLKDDPRWQLFLEKMGLV